MLELRFQLQRRFLLLLGTQILGGGASQKVGRLWNQLARLQRQIGSQVEEREQISENKTESAENVQEREAADFSLRKSRRLLKLTLRLKETKIPRRLVVILALHKHDSFVSEAVD